jgi:hypothetical protein
MDAGKGGAAKFDAYGAQRIGAASHRRRMARAFAWNKAINLEVRFGAPLAAATTRLRAEA